MDGLFSQTSPMACVEPMLAECCRHLNWKAKSINQVDFLQLAHDIVQGTPSSVRTKSYQNMICGVTDESKKLGKKYFYNFMKRDKTIVHTTKVHQQYVSRLEWSTYHNIQKMYDLVYAKMVHCGVALKLDAPVFFNKNNEIINPLDENKTGCLSNVQVIDPSYVLFADKTGLSTNMKLYKQGNIKVISETGFSGANEGIHFRLTLYNHGIYVQKWRSCYVLFDFL
jgi:hypothetical protein